MIPELDLGRLEAHIAHKHGRASIVVSAGSDGPGAWADSVRLPFRPVFGRLGFLDPDLSAEQLGA